MATALLVVAPGVASARLDYRVAPGDTLSAIAQRHGVSSSAIASASGLANPDSIVSGTLLVIPDGQSGSSSARHTVRPGETLSQIASRYGVSVAALARANGISNPNLVRSGQQLSISGTASSSSGSSGSASGGSSSAQTAGRDDVRRLITAAAQRHGWRPGVPLGLAMQESGWNNSVVSSAGARGIMQVLPATAEWVSRYLLNGQRLDLNVPADNVAAGMAYLDHLYGRFDGNVEHALAAYFEGPERVARNGGPTSSAQRYADNVLALAARYR